MAGDVKKIILVSRYTTLVGDTSFTTAPVNIREFASAWIFAWRGAAIGSLDTFEIRVQQSTDLRIWSDLGSSLTPAADSEDSEEYDFTMDWLRLTIVITESAPDGQPAVTCWVMGNFVPREE